ncbi:MAG: helix-hairpin-helix domain-containing protein [Pseudohongiellaceae bacterium]
MIRLAVHRLAIAAVLLAFSTVGFAVEAQPETTQQVQVLDINSADAAAIAAALDGIGMTKAKEIVAYREMYGSFHSVDELAEVKGIGMATIERNRQRIIVVNK